MTIETPDVHCWQSVISIPQIFDKLFIAESQQMGKNLNEEYTQLPSRFFVIHAISQKEYLFPVYHHYKYYKIMNNIDPTMEISANLQEYSKVIDDINNALDEFYEVLPDIKETTGEERKENLDIWVKHINDLKDSCQQLIDGIEEIKREINF